MTTIIEKPCLEKENVDINEYCGGLNHGIQWVEWFNFVLEMAPTKYKNIGI